MLASARATRGRWSRYAETKRALERQLCTVIQAAHLRPVRCAWIDYTWREQHRRRDPSNIAAGGRKLVEDTLVSCGVLRGDGWRDVAGWSDAFEVSPIPGVLIILRETA